MALQYNAAEFDSLPPLMILERKHEAHLRVFASDKVHGIYPVFVPISAKEVLISKDMGPFEPKHDPRDCDIVDLDRTTHIVYLDEVDTDASYLAIRIEKDDFLPILDYMYVIDKPAVRKLFGVE